MLPDPTAEERLVARLMASLRNEEQVTLILGSGIGGDATPRVANVLRLAEQYAAGRSDKRRAAARSRAGP